MGLDFGRKSSEGWTDEQKKVLSIIPHVTGGLSVLGSAFIIYDVASDRKKWSSTYHRLLFGMGILDFVSSFATSLSTVPMPQESGEYSYGNVATCTLQGFFVHFNIASPLYNLMLSIYFLLSVSFNWKKADIKAKAELWLHGIPFTWAFVTALVIVVQDGFNDSSLWCWINSTPKGCFDSEDPEMECERCGQCPSRYWMSFFFIPLWLAAFGTIVVMGMLVHSVRKTEKKAAKWRPSSVRFNHDNAGTDDSNRSLSSSRSLSRSTMMRWKPPSPAKTKLDEEDTTSESAGESGNHSRLANDTDASNSQVLSIIPEKEEQTSELSIISETGEQTATSTKETTQHSRPGSVMERSHNNVIKGTPSRRSMLKITNSSILWGRLGESDMQERRERKKASRMTRLVVGQAFRYCAVFWVTWLPGSTNRILQLMFGYSYFWVMFLHVIFTPMQGLLNFIVYIDLRVRKWWVDKKNARAKAKEIEKRRPQPQKMESDILAAAAAVQSVSCANSSSRFSRDDYYDISEAL